MNILDKQPLECPSCKIDIIHGLEKFFSNGEIICPHCNTKIICSNKDEVQSQVQEFNDALKKMKNIFKKG